MTSAQEPNAPLVTYELNDGVAEIMLNRPERLNAVGIELRRDLISVMTRFIFDPLARVGILSGVGRAFCAGRDLKEEGSKGSNSGDNPYGYPEILNRQLLLNTDKFLIAAVQGFAIGQGFYYVLGCDYRIATTDAIFSMPEIETGAVGPFDMGIYENIPWAIAVEIALMGRKLGAPRLCQVGILNEVVDPGLHLERARAVAAEVIALPDELVRATKRLMVDARPGLSADHYERAAAIRKDLRSHPSRQAAVRGQ